MPSIPYFNEGEVWFCKLGKNIGSEQDGGGTDLLRPVVIVRKHNKDLFTGIPLTTKKKGGVEDRAILSQIRSFSSQRLSKKSDNFK